jgi:hypothetical protein
MTTYISVALRLLISERAQYRCEYCLFPEKFAAKRHQCDHIYAEKHGALTAEHNLCLCCLECNRYKGSDMSSLDPLTGQPVFLFHPRRDVWHEHFRLKQAYIEGISPVGRATVRLLRFNQPVRLEERAMLIELGVYFS